MVDGIYKKMSVSPENDQLVKQVVLMNKLPFYLHGYLFPFIIAYAFGGYAWLQVFGYEQYEIGIAINASILLLQLLCILFCFWSVDIRCLLTCKKITDPDLANFAKVVPTLHNGSSELVPIHKRKSKLHTNSIWLNFQKVTYVYDGDERKCFRAIDFPVQETFRYYQNSKGFLDESEITKAQENFGNNEMEMVIPEFKELFLERATAPFFVFQVFCVVLWCLDEYWYYSLFTLFMLVAFEASLVYQQLKNMAEIRKMGNKPYRINVYRSRKWRPVLSNELIAGDIVSLTRSSSEAGEERHVPCDILLLRGRMIVDEAMLTGESVPQMKEPIDDANGDTVLDLGVHARVHLISGGTRIVQHDPPSKLQQGKDGGASRPSDNGCVGFVLRTGFNTSQGKLLRTILFGVKRVTANNLETFAFIVFLLIFAIAASAYVWIVGSADPERSRYKLVLNCVLILTSVVPPELPIELSLAVNSSLLALSKLLVYCTEPFRIPFAGKIDICCFDKTGTLTSDSLMVEGIAGVESSCENDTGLCQVTSAPSSTQKVVAACHALVNVDDDLVGDPLEQAMFKAAEWNLTKADVVIPRKKTSGLQPLKIIQRFHFSSLLKRMSVLISEEDANIGNTHLVATKGAAEVLKPMFVSVPDNYDSVHQNLAKRGARVLALGIKDCRKTFSSQEIRNLKREDLECELNFVGFVIVSTPLKFDSKAVMQEIKRSSHHVTMITGDNPLTACYVGRVLCFTGSKGCLLLSPPELGSEWKWKCVEGSEEFALDVSQTVHCKRDLCLTGDGMTYLRETAPRYFDKILPNVRIFARVSPKQKEQIIISLKQLGFKVLMCGDGTNDVGALKHADVGIALLSGSAPPPPKKSPIGDKQANGVTPRPAISAPDHRGSATDASRGHKSSSRSSASMLAVGRPPAAVDAVGKGQPRNARNRQQQRIEELTRRKKKLQDMMQDMDDGEPKVVKMGDASIAAPFSYKLSSIVAVCHIIKQGRCTLVTTLQMFKILALNALVLAYSQSVLFLDGVKFSDAQATLQGLLLAGCFLFISRSKPLKVLSQQRPLPNIFNAYTILTVTSQFAVHFFALVFLVTEAKKRDPKEKIDFEADFEANLLNSTVYILSLATQIITFAVNYRGEPFMERLTGNKPLLYSLLASGSFMLALAADLMPEVNDSFEVVHFEPEFRLVILQTLAGIATSTWLLDRSLRFILGSGRVRRLR